jgi:hypothetical protein
MDRLLDVYLRASPRGRQFTSNFPLQPFIKQATALNYSDPRVWLYTTIGDMARDTRALQYMYAPPFLPDYSSLPQSTRQLTPRGGTALTIHDRPMTLPAKTNDTGETAHVIFANVRCTKASYRIDVFVAGSASLDLSLSDNLGYLGHITRLGMGDGGDPKDGVRNAGRCRKPAVTRVLTIDSEEQKARLREAGGVHVVVTELPSERLLMEDEWSKLPGFKANVVWR